MTWGRKQIKMGVEVKDVKERKRLLQSRMNNDCTLAFGDHGVQEVLIFLLSTTGLKSWWVVKTDLKNKRKWRIFNATAFSTIGRCYKPASSSGRLFKAFLNSLPKTPVHC
ncbi:hypothetical protein PoB_001848400 [Plakobranchus ocellatus]|uniref:Uncharacterized protein n=1 Tax=Plakobranchus ocellatus TaxID=259542 RepID=A0AAV3Z9I1_9GAST|nr:hypothetical protein PoB_001848400 [Plakobranchus ocellatus]